MFIYHTNTQTAFWTSKASKSLMTTLTKTIQASILNLTKHFLDFSIQTLTHPRPITSFQLSHSALCVGYLFLTRYLAGWFLRFVRLLALPQFAPHIPCCSPHLFIHTMSSCHYLYIVCGLLIGYVSMLSMSLDNPSLILRRSCLFVCPSVMQTLILFLWDKVLKIYFLYCAK